MVTLRQLAEEFGIERSHLRKWVLAQDIRPVKVRDGGAGQMMLAVGDDQAHALRKRRQELGFKVISSKSEIAIRLYERHNDDGTLEDLRLEFPITEFGGTIPVPGDRIVDLWAAAVGERRRIPTNRTVFEVEARYFLPHAFGTDLVYVVLVITRRPGTDGEADLFRVA